MYSISLTLLINQAVADRPYSMIGKQSQCLNPFSSFQQDITQPDGSSGGPNK
ncbi:hypothetical protein GH884_26865 [Bacillus thuringiensis]|nr:hypothetical protein [Bacillus thuringiensis]